MASSTGAAAPTKLTLAIDESATKRGLACRTPCALLRALFVDAVAATAMRRTGALARGVEAQMVRAVTSWHCFGLVPYQEQKCIVRGATVVEAGDTTEQSPRDG